MEVRQVTNAELVAASRLTIPGLPSDEGATRQVLRDADEAMGIDAGCQVVALDGRTLLGSCLYVPTPGQGATVLAPGLSTSCSEDQVQNVRTRLVTAAREKAFAEGAVLVQALLDDSPDTAVARAFLDSGFALLTLLKYLEAPLRRIAADRPKGPWKVTSYTDAREERFSETITQTYAGSLDCPALDGTRSPEEVLTGHKGSGLFTPDGWLLVSDGEADVGVILVNRHTNRPACEIVYMGVVPQYRGRGLGRLLVAEAAAVAKHLGVSVLTVAVDVENEPACRLYRATGFRDVGQRYAYFATPSP